jgi:arylsulfatase A-like enzyme
MLYINFLEPHSPYFGPFDSIHSPQEVYLPQSFNHIVNDDFHLRYQIWQQKYLSLDEEYYRDLIAKYWGLVTQVDLSVGAILDELENLGLSDNTIVVYTSDHGDLMGAHKYIGKGIMLEESVKVPFMIRFKTEPKQQMIIEDPVSLVDVVPTLLDLMEKPVHNHLQGQSLRPLMKGNPVPQDHVFIEWNPFQNWVDNALQEKSEKAVAIAESSRGVISPDGYKLILFNMGKNLLFNLKQDPYEMNNLYGQPGYEDITTDLTGRILKWQKEVGDTVSLEQNSIQY